MAKPHGPILISTHLINNIHSELSPEMQSKTLRKSLNVPSKLNLDLRILSSLPATGYGLVFI